jgi:hypothetical protein
MSFDAWTEAATACAREETPRTSMKTKTPRVPVNPANQHVPLADVANRPAIPMTGKTTTAPAPLASGTAIHPEIIARATEPGPLPKIIPLGPSFSQQVFFDSYGKADFLTEHYCNLNRFRDHEASELPSLRDDRWDRFMKSGKHLPCESTMFGCITERKGNGATFTMTLDDKLYAILGVATDEESASLVWEWLSKQYEILRTASYRMNHFSNRGDLELRRSGVLGNTYDECDVPDRPGNWPWFSYIVNDDRFYESLYFLVKDCDPMPQLAYQWCRHIRSEKMRLALSRPTDKVLEI